MKNIISENSIGGFCGLPKYVNIRQMMSISIKHLELGSSTKELGKKELRRFFRDSAFDKREYRFIDRSGKFLMFYGMWNYRFDHSKTFNNFADRFPDADIIACKEKKNYRFRPGKALQGLLLFVVWLFQCIIKGYSPAESFVIIPHVYAAFQCFNCIKRTEPKKYRFLVVYYDVSADDNCAVQLFRHDGITTMTMQHGIFAKKSTVKSIADYGLEFTNSIAEYYLAWNAYTKDEAIKAGMDQDKVVVLGIPKYIDHQTNSTESKQIANGVFGVILNNTSFPEHNLRMIKLANEISDRFLMKFVLRYHPQMNGTEYDALCGGNYLGKNDNHTSIEEYTHIVDFSLISSSSVFVDLLFLKHPTYRVVVSDNDTYSSVKFNSFSTADEFVRLFEQGNVISREVFDYLCTTSDVYSSYRRFFDSFIEGDK